MEILNNHLSPIYLGKGCVKNAIELFQKNYSSIVLVHDAALADWANILQSHVEKSGSRVLPISVPSGEDSKCRAMKAEIEDTMLEAGSDRKTLLIAFGGGMITDLAGFVAATYMRGIDSLAIPTTILGMVDASIGGKTGINTLHGKNLIGAYHLPKGIIIDFQFLSTLPFETYRSGFAEIIKYGCIYDRALFEMLEDTPDFQKRNEPFLLEAIKASIETKLHVVDKDPKEHGYRRILNFGHTIAHAIERLSSYRISHGDAVAQGMIGESYLSYLEKHIPQNEHKRITTCINRFEFTPFPLSDISFEQFYEAMILDKKSEGQTPRFVMLQTIGKARSFDQAYCSNAAKDNIEKTFNYLKDLS